MKCSKIQVVKITAFITKQQIKVVKAVDWLQHWLWQEAVCARGSSF